jgi:hypothetical protein
MLTGALWTAHLADFWLDLWIIDTNYCSMHLLPAQY